MTWTSTCVVSVSLCCVLATGCGEEPVENSRPEIGLGSSCPAIAIDGAFTGWQAGRTEWPGPFLEGRYGDFYFDYCDSRLRILNDWHLRDDAPIAPDMYNLFLLANERNQFELRVHHDRLEVRRDGSLVETSGKGAAGFATSPRNPEPHAIFELELEIGPHETRVRACDPGPGEAASPEEALVDEPNGFVLGLRSGGCDAAIATGPLLTATDPHEAERGEHVLLRGLGFGDSGTVRFAALRAEVVSWSDDEVVAVVPDVLGPVEVTVESAGLESPPVPFVVRCTPVCGASECGGDGCGGLCGICPAGSACVDHHCTCVPDCASKQCGSDGCEGSCGSCPAGQGCSGFQCVCAPDCSGKECGADGCGGACGICPPEAVCKDGACVCMPNCYAKSCGPDGCGGSCGTCGAGTTCVGTECVCAPSCAGKPCGPDGCGGACGSCPAGTVCEAHQCVKHD